MTTSNDRRMTTATAEGRSLRRHILGLSGLILLSVGIYFYIRPPDLASVEFVQGSCVKSGLILLATWLAFPQLDRLPGWLLGGLIIFMLAVATRPRIVFVLLRYGLILAPILGLIWMLRRMGHR